MNENCEAAQSNGHLWHHAFGAHLWRICDTQVLIVNATITITITIAAVASPTLCAELISTVVVVTAVTQPVGHCLAVNQSLSEVSNGQAAGGCGSVSQATLV